MTVKLSEQTNRHFGVKIEEKRSIESTKETIRLSKQGIHILDGDNRGDEITCLQGLLWITQQDDMNDYVLSSGESMVISQNGRVIIQAVTDALAQSEREKFIPHDRLASGSLINKN